MTWHRARRATVGAVAVVAAMTLLAAVPQSALSRADGSVLERYDFRAAGARAVTLPHALREISGLATTDDGRVFAHGDEYAIVFQLEPYRGRVTSVFSLGAPIVRGDFEGIAIAGTRFFLMTSTGNVYETREGTDGAVVPFTVYDTGFGRACELEGLAFEPSDRSLIIGCKHPRDPALRRQVTLFRWSIDRHAPAKPDRISISLRDIVRESGVRSFRPSSVERDARTGHYLIVAGPERVLVEVTSAGAVVAVRSLDARLHPQPEGIALLGDSAVLIADEGGRGRATLVRYARAR